MASGPTTLTRERILSAAEEVIRRFGPGKATVVDVARALGVSHAAVYQHVASKAELRQLVVAGSGPAPQRLRRLFDTLSATKRRRAAEDPELFAAYRTLAGDSQAVRNAHVDELVALAAAIIRAGVKEGTFRKVDPIAAGRAVLWATARFHHPVHAGEWGRAGLHAEYDEVWKLLMEGLRAPKRAR
jgi:AcrR family transcriptional regulator